MGPVSPAVILALEAVLAVFLPYTMAAVLPVSLKMEDPEMASVPRLGLAAMAPVPSVPRAFSAPSSPAPLTIDSPMPI